MLKLFLWLRYLRKKKIVLLSIAAVALSVSLLIVVASLFTGFIDAFEQSAVETLGDVVLAAPSPFKFAKYELLVERLEQISAVEAASAVLSAPGLLHVGKGDVHAVEVWGIDPARRARVTAYKSFLVRQKASPGEPSFEVMDSPEKTGGFVGIGVLAEPDEMTDEYDFAAVEKMLGSPAVLTTGSLIEDKGPSSGGSGRRFKRRTIPFAIADVVFTGVYEVDRSVAYLPIEQLQQTLHRDEGGPVADRIQIKLAPDVDVEVALAEIRGVWQVFAMKELGWGAYLANDADIETAKQMQSRWVFELKKQMGLLLVIFGVVSFSVVVLIFCIFYLIVRLKQKDIAITKSCGAASSSVAWVFVGFGACVGITGSCIGVVLGYIITKNINVIEDWIRIAFGLKLWKSSVYMFSKIPNQVNWDMALRIALLAIGAAIVGALIPALVAARTRPVEILRYE
ncbi:MAG: FtsX-like permease family protein [Phycisphaerales bacterium]|nr:MAG: FtsX-like permease family protein [Phycisphaerales bacterium]